MKLDDHHEIRLVLAINVGTGQNPQYGDVYDDLRAFIRDHPNGAGSYVIGYVVIDTRTGFVPEPCNDFNYTFIQAFEDFLTHVHMGPDVPMPTEIRESGADGT